MLELLGLVFGNIFSGGATGLIGVILQRFADYKNKQLDLKLQAQKQTHEIALREADARIAAQEWAGRTQVARVEAAGREAAADAAAFGESFKMEPTRYSEAVKPTWGQGWLLVLLDGFRGIVRPALTIYLCALTTLIYLQARVLLSHEDLTTADAMELEKTIIGTILYLTTTCVLWWFGTRNKHEGPKV